MEKTPNAGPTESSEESAPKGPPLLTPLEWAQRLGLVRKNGKDRPPAPNWRHAAADQLHGWSAHGQNTVDPLLLNQEDYEAALAEAPGESGKYAPHARNR